MKKILDYSAKLLELVSIVLLVAMLSIISYQVFLRFVLNNPTSWSEELAILLLIWFGSLSVTLGIKEKTHMSIDYLYLKFGKNTQKILDILYYIMLLIFSYLMISEGFEIMKIAKFQRLPATGISRQSYYFVLVINGILSIVYTIQNIFEKIKE